MHGIKESSMAKPQQGLKTTSSTPLNGLNHKDEKVMVQTGDSPKQSHFRILLRCYFNFSIGKYEHLPSSERLPEKREEENIKIIIEHIVWFKAYFFLVKLRSTCSPLCKI